MTTLPTTGVELIDRELKRRGPFPNAEAAETAAARLLAIWHVLAPYSDVDDGKTRQTHQR